MLFTPGGAGEHGDRTPPRIAKLQSTHGVPASGYTAWVYRDSRWELSQDRSEPGFESGGRPDEPGEYEGEVVRKSSVPSKR